MPAGKLFLLFHSIHDVLRAEKILKGRSIVNELVPDPRNLSSDCGMSIVLEGDIEDVAGFLQDIQTAGIYAYDGRDYIPVET